MNRLILLIASTLIAGSVIGQEPTEATLTEALLTVDVSDMKGTPSVGDFITFLNQNTKKTYSGITKDDGTFRILIPKGSKYTVQYKSFGGDDDYAEIDVPVFDGLLDFNFSIRYELPKVYVLDNVYFDTGKSTLRSTSFKTLNNFAELMTHKKTMKVEIAGHTDDVGEDDNNMKLSQSRAESVKSYLTKKGISGDRLVAKGYGETMPVAPNTSDTGRQKNRRTEVKILSN